MTTDELALLDAILADPDDDDLRLVYADWLEERGDPRADWLRLEVDLGRGGDVDVLETRERLRNLQSHAGSEWVQSISRTRVQSCYFQGEGADRVCGRRWYDLNVTDSPFERECSACGELVRYCRRTKHVTRRLRQRPGRPICIGEAIAEQSFGSFRESRLT